MLTPPPGYKRYEKTIDVNGVGALLFAWAVNDNDAEEAFALLEKRARQIASDGGEMYRQGPTKFCPHGIQMSAASCCPKCHPDTGILNLFDRAEPSTNGVHQ